MTLEQQERRISPKEGPGARGRVLGVWKTGKPKNLRVTGLHISRRKRGSRTFAPPASLIAASAPYPNSLARDNTARSESDPASTAESSRDETSRRVLERAETRGESRVPPSFTSSYVEQQANVASSMARTKDLHVAGDPPRYLLLSWPTKLAAIISWEVSIPIKGINVSEVARHDNPLYSKDESEEKTEFTTRTRAIVRSNSVFR